MNYDDLLVLRDLEKIVWSPHPRRGHPYQNGPGSRQRELYSIAAFGPFSLELHRRAAYVENFGGHAMQIEEGFEPRAQEYWSNTLWNYTPKYSEEIWPRPPHDLWPSPETALKGLKRAIARRIEETGLTPTILARAAFTTGFDSGARGCPHEILMLDPNYQRGAEMGAQNAEYTAHMKELRSFHDRMRHR